MNTVSGTGFNQSTIFGSKITKPIKTAKRTKKALTEMEKANESRKKSLKDLIDNNRKVGKIYKDLQKGDIDTEGAAKKILDAIV